MSKRGVSSSAEPPLVKNEDLASSSSKKARTVSEGKIAVAGRIASVHLINFMCHKNLQIDFDTERNSCFFIGGANGSGKSALFAAINLCLGGKGAANDRGNNVQSYIKEGATQAKIKITLTNEGLNSHPTFDQFISVERKINMWTSRYSIKSIEVTSSNHRYERVVSDKKSDVDLIVNLFNIHLTNPAFWITQEKSRTFLSSYEPSLLYKLFLQSTNIENIQDSHTRLADCLNECFQIMLVKSEELKKEKGQLEQMQKQRFSQQQLDSDRALIARHTWKLLFCKIRDYEDEIKINQKKQEVHGDLHKKYKALYAENRAARSNAQKKVENLCDELEVHQSEISEATTDLEKKNRGVVISEGNKNQFLLLFQRKQREIKSIQTVVSQGHRELEVLLKKQGDKQQTAQLAQKEKDLQNIIEEQTKLEQELEKMKETRSTTTEVKTKEDDKKYEMFGKISNLRKKVMQMEETVNRARFTAKNVINRFGPHMADILTEISKCTSKFVNIPKGPVGNYISINEDKWACAVEDCFKKIASNFICSSQEDAKVLRDIFTKLGIPATDRPTVIVTKFFGKPHEKLEEPSLEYTTIYKLIEINDPDIHNVVIDITGCEQIVLLEEKTDAMILMGSNAPPKNARKAYTLDGYEAFAGEAKRQYRIYCRSKRQTTGVFGNKGEKINESALIKSIEETKSEISKMESILKNHEESTQKLRNQIQTSNSQIRIFQTKLSELNEKRVLSQRSADDLRLKLEQEADGDQLQNVKESIEEMEKKISKLKEEAAEIQESCEESTREFNIARKDRQEASKILDVLQKEIIDFRSQSMEIQIEISKYDDEGENFKYRIDKLRADEQNLYIEEARLKTEKDDAASSIEREKLLNPMPIGEQDPPDLKDFPPTQKAVAQLLQMKKVLDLASRECDMTVTCESVKEFKDKYKKHRYFCHMIKKTVEQLRQVHESRLKIFPSLKKYTELKVSDKFRELLEIRGYFVGGLLFDHYKQTLSINVQSCKQRDAMLEQREDADNIELDEDEKSHDEDSGAPRKKKSKRQLPKLKDIKGLSGGERSFITVSLVMALWEVMEQPFRMIDEVDVFMDMSFRKLAMDLLVEMATKKFPHSQLFFFTPQGMKDLKNVDGLQVFEMKKIDNQQ